MSKAMSAAPIVRLELEPARRGAELSLVHGGGDDHLHPSEGHAHVLCPDPACSRPAVIEDRWTWASTDGPADMVKVRCAGGCWYTVMEDDLQAA
jgi:hypothetical protein